MNSKIVKFFNYFIFNKKKRKVTKNECQSSIIENNGKNNKLIILDDKGKETDIQYLPLLSVRFNGDNNTIILHKNIDFVGHKEIVCSSNNYIKIGKSKIVDIFVTELSPESKLVIGDDCQFGFTIIELHREPGLEVSIGNRCLFSRETEILPSDGHSIFDFKNNKILNYPKSITIGNHVWIARHAKILKGSDIPDNSVVAMDAVYTQSSNIKQDTKDSGCVFAGLPAKVIKSDINWDIKSTYDYEISKGK